MNSSFGSEYLVVNLSGETYDTTKFQGPVMDVKMSKHVPPLDVLLRLCVCAHKWLSGTPSRCLVLHGSKADAMTKAGHPFGAVLVFLSCYLCWTGTAEHPKEALPSICNICQVPENSALPSQHRYLSYFEGLHREAMKANKMPTLELTQVVLVGLGGDGLKRFLQVCQDESSIFQADLDTCTAADALVPLNLKCRGDLAMRVYTRRVGTSGEHSEELELQICFHSAFVRNGFVRFPNHEVDQLGKATNNECAVDIFFRQLCKDETEETLEAKTAATAASAVAAGPHMATATASATLEGEKVETTPEGPSPAAVFNIADSNSPRVVFKADDIDAFFADL
jgi:hypothetical protein